MPIVVRPRAALAEFPDDVGLGSALGQLIGQLPSELGQYLSKLVDSTTRKNTENGVLRVPRQTDRHEHRVPRGRPARLLDCVADTIERGERIGLGERPESRRESCVEVVVHR